MSLYHIMVAVATMIADYIIGWVKALCRGSLPTQSCLYWLSLQIVDIVLIHACLLLKVEQSVM